MKRKTMSLILHIILIFCMLGCGLFFFGFVPFYGQELVRELPGCECYYLPCLIWELTFSIPFFVSAVPAWQIFSSLKEEGGAFSEKNGKRFRLIAFMAWLAAFLFVAGMLITAEMGAGAITITLVFTPLVVFIGLSVGFACYVMSRLVMDSARLKRECDLTI